MSPPAGRLVDPNGFRQRIVSLVPSSFDIVLEYSPQPGIVLINNPRNGLDRHILHHHHHQCLEEEREAAPRTGPRYGDLFDTTLLALHARHPGAEIGPILKEVQMTPSSLLSIVSAASFCTAMGTRESAAPDEINIDIQTTLLKIKLAVSNLPRNSQAQSQLKQFRIFHS